MSAPHAPASTASPVVLAGPLADLRHAVRVGEDQSLRTREGSS